ncbi:CYTH domain-containing protein [Phascolarctobacterium succinatutens]|uniref:CYTH domain-containing protein n=1 Tax=Phascolarctobacterium succinatutens TaxID=626940 RepID=UPI0026E93622|nr:CYTH domain-containing protein [Phascolarctobacterium succinatutens]
MAKNTEIELKLLLSKEDLERLLTLDFMVQAVREGSRRVRHLVSTYYDTQELTLKEHGIAYRVRDKGDGSFEATVKTQKQSAGGLSERLELNLPLAEAQPVLDGFAALGLGFELSELAPCGVQALFTVDVERITYILDYAGAVCELAIDKGAIRCGEKSESIDEVEIELLEGEVQALLELKERIAAAVTLRAEERSKFARGLALLQ